jgi:hypothetical protein
MKSGASDPFGDSEDERSESAESRTESGANRERADSEDERSESAESADGEKRPVNGDEQGESANSRTENEANRERGSTDENRTDRAEPADAAGADSEDEPTGAGGEGFSRDELPLVLRRDRVKDERPEVHQLFVQRETHDRAVDAERALEDRLGVDLSRTDAREAIYLAGMAHLDDAEEILRSWGYDL